LRKLIWRSTRLPEKTLRLFITQVEGAAVQHFAQTK
jgi:hypothetical protein